MPPVLLVRSGPVARVRLNRPEKRNAQTVEMWAELRRIGRELERDREIRVVVVSGEGPSFSAGIDLGLLLAQAGGADLSAVELVQQSFTWLRSAPFVTIAAVRGHAVGAGMQLALACDLRILAADAILGLPEVDLGILPDLGGCAWLPEMVGAARAKQLIFLAERIDARTALDLGIANQVVPDDELEDVVTALASRLAARAPLALAGAKRAIEAASTSPAEALRVSAEEVGRCLRSEEFREAARAVIERRAPAGEPGRSERSSGPPG